MHVERWTRWQGESSEADLLPVRWAKPHEGGEQANTYATYTEQEARNAFPELFAALGMPNVRDID